MLNKNIIKKLNNISNTNKVFEVKITSNNWLLESETGLYYKDVNHNLATKYLFISGLNDANDSVELAHKYINDNTVRIYSDSTMNINLYILATTDVSLVQNQINDDIVSSSKTWSSKKINNEFSNKIEVKSIKDFPNESGVTDDSIRINKLFEYCIKYNKIAELEHGKIYNCKSKVIIDIGNLCVNGNNAIFDFTEMNVQSETVPHAMLITSNNTNIDSQNNNFIKNLKIQGLNTFQDLNNVKKCAGIFCDVVSYNKAISHISIDNVTISNFKWGIIYGNNSYIIRNRGLEVFRCETGIYMGRDIFVNYGENINFVSSSIYECGTGVFNENNIGAFNLVNCSIDYNYNQLRAENGSMIFLTNCHIEGGSLTLLCNDNSVININNSWIVWTESLKEKYFKGNSKNGIIFNDCVFFGGYLNNSTHQNIVNGSLKITFKDSRYTKDNGLFKQLLNIENSKIPFKFFEGQVAYTINDIYNKWKCNETEIVRDNTLQNTGYHCYKITKKLEGQTGFMLTLPKSQNNCCIKVSLRSQTDKNIIIHCSSGYKVDGINLLDDYENKIEHHYDNFNIKSTYSDYICDIESNSQSNTWILEFDMSNININEFIVIDRIELFEY